MYKRLKKNLGEDDFMRMFTIGFILGLVTCFTAQFQSVIPIETWFWFIALIVILYVGAMIFCPVIVMYALGFAGFLVGVIVSLVIWIILPEIQNFFSSIFG